MIDWKAWEKKAERSLTYLDTCPALLDASAWDTALALLAPAYRNASLTGGLDAHSRLDRESFKNFIRWMPVTQHYDFYVTACEYADEPTGPKYVTLNLFVRTGVKVQLTFIDFSVSVMFRRRVSATHYKGYHHVCLRGDAYSDFENLLYIDGQGAE